MRWLDGFRIGHAEIDGDHEGLVDDVNAIADGFAEGRGEEAYEKCLEFRVDVVRHFENENRLLREARFPRWQAHVRSHDMFIDRLSSYCAACGERCRKSEKEACVSDLVAMLGEHFVRHDMDFKSHLEYEGLADGRRSGGSRGSGDGD